MKAHFIRTPDCRDFYPPIGFSYLASEMRRRGCPVRYVDLNVVDYPFKQMRTNPRGVLKIPPDWHVIERVLGEESIELASSPVTTP